MKKFYFNLKVYFEHVSVYLKSTFIPVDICYGVILKHPLMETRNIKSCLKVARVVLTAFKKQGGGALLRRLEDLRTGAVSFQSSVWYC